MNPYIIFDFSCINNVKKKIIPSINSLRKILNEITVKVREDTPIENFEKTLNNDFVSQLIFDILYGKYCMESPKMTLSKYCKEHVNYKWDKSKDIEGDELNKAISRTIKMMSNEVKLELEKAGHQTLRNEIIMCGIDHDKWLKYRNPINTKFLTTMQYPKCNWDYYYYNGNSELITYKQFRRNLQISKHYTYNAFEEDYKVYDNFVKTFLIDEHDTVKDCFFKSMDFYHLEIYKRLDFIFKLAIRMEKESIPTIDQKHPLLKRYTPEVCCPTQVDGQSYQYPTKYKYYRPFLFPEKVFPPFEQIPLDAFDGSLDAYYLIRAKAFEAFNYEYQFVSNDYDDIWSFISTHFDVLSYHEPEKEWFNGSKDKKRDQLIRIKNAIKINDALFWISDVREPPSRSKRKN